MGTEQKAPAELPPSMVVTIDLRTITLGEMAAVELASGEAFSKLWKTPTTRRLAAMYIERVCRRDLSSSASAPSWSELSDLRLLEL